MSQHRRVILHTCKPENDDGLPFRCACTQRLTAKEAQDSISRGEARWKKQLNVHAGLVDIRTELVLVKWQTPLQARSISAFDIERAYVDDSAAARRRIEAFPVENQICLARKCGKQGAMAIPFYKDFRRRLKKTGCSSFTFVQMIEYSAPTFSRWINGKGSITPERLADVRLCLDFVEETVRRSNFPVDFRRRELFDLWKRFKVAAAKEHALIQRTNHSDSEESPERSEAEHAEALS